MGNAGEDRPSLSLGWILAACGVMIALLIAGGCATPAAQLESLDGQLAAWRLVRDEGRTWDDATWHGRLAGYAAECRVLRAVLADQVQPGDAFRFKDEELTRGE